MRLILTIPFTIIILILATLSFGWFRTTQITNDVEAEFPADGQFIEVEGGRLHLTDTGSRKALPNQTIVLLHGATSNLRDMTSSIGRPLSQKYRIIAIDRSGHGWSSRFGGRGDAKLDIQARMITEALNKIGVQQAIFIGHSWAGALVMRLALDYPQLTQKIVLISPVTHPWPGGVSWYYTAATTPILGSLLLNTIIAPVARASMKQALQNVFSPSMPPEDYSQKTGVELVFRPTEFLANSEDVKDLLPQVVTQSSLYSGLTLPALIITADTDSVVSPAIHAQTVAKDLRNSKLIVLSGAGHAPHHSRTADILQAIEAFVSAQ